MVHTPDSFILINADVISGPARKPDCSIFVEHGFISKIKSTAREDSCSSIPVIDAKGKIAGPGLVDMHIHGAGGFDTTGKDIEYDIVKIAQFLERGGICSFQPALFFDLLTLKKIRDALENNPYLAKKIPGVYIEGPFINSGKRGGLPIESIKEFSEKLMEEILSITFRNRPLVKTMTIAPEKEGSEKAVAMLLDSGVLPAWGHSNAYLDEIQNMEPLHLTHLFNAMNGLDHRRPGLGILPFLKRHGGMTYEIIGDGIHINPAMLEFVFGSNARKNICLVSDGMKSAGIGSGETEYLGQRVVSDGRCSRYLESGVLIGSTMLISQTAQELFANGLIDEVDFFRIASTNPAAVTGMSDRGILQEGKRADIVLCNPDMTISEVFTTA